MGGEVNRCQNFQDFEPNLWLVDTENERGKQQQTGTCCSSQSNRDISPSFKDESMVVYKSNDGQHNNSLQHFDEDDSSSEISLISLLR
jgi:hypothetical protein